MMAWTSVGIDLTTTIALVQQSTIAAGMQEYGQALGSGLWPNIEILPETEARQTGQPLTLPPLRI